MITLPVSPDKCAALDARLRKLGILEQDLEEHFVRAGGPGGQHVNKVSTCVVLTHRPSGLTVRCQEERSQGMNRYRARKRLADKMEEVLLGAESRLRQAVEKLRRQKRKRSKRAKEKVLEAKHRRAGLKATRKAVGTDD
ncbi:MAG: peptide chain release factor-like protein [Nitrospirae bacterium]|nr:MAG: peptide chain release factor-like protein [Nitrospirota bacterium]